MRQYEMYELTFKGKVPEDSYVDVDLAAEFTVNGATKEVKGFYAGNEEYKIRFYPEEQGKVSWKVNTELSLEGKMEGEEICSAGEKNGMVKAAGTHFETQDGTIFYPFGTTIYAFAHQKKELIEETFQTLEKAPFNKVRLCVFPKFYDYNREDPEYFPFQKNEDEKWDTSHPCFEFWENLESVIFRLAEMGIQSDLILFHSYDKWGFSNMSSEHNREYLEYVTRRFSAIPEIWWSLANEFDLCFDRTMEEWYEIEQMVAKNDPYGHLLSNHNCFSFYDFKRPSVTHCSVQSTQVESAEKWIEEYQKPFIYDECCYEGDLSFSWGNISGFEMANRFWIACVQGAYVTHGEVFLSADDILWWSKGGTLKGESVSRIAFLKSIIEEMPGALTSWKMSPMDLLDEEILKELAGKPFKELHMSMPESMQESHLVKDKLYCGHCGEEAYIQYFARHCVRKAEWKLPETHTYTIEVIDMWAMTRSKVQSGVSGIVSIDLPGKEGIAVLAVKE